MGDKGVGYGIIDRLLGRGRQDSETRQLREKLERLEADQVLTLFALDSARMQSQDSPSTYGSFYIDPQYPTRGPVFGTRNISDEERLFGSQREPIVIFYIVKMAVDMLDNWFRVYEIGNEDDDTLDDQVQRVLKKMNAKRELTRAAIFERRYGTSILLLSVSIKGNESWGSPLYTMGPDNERVYVSPENRKVVKITPYPKTKFSVKKYDEKPDSIRLGEPETYEIRRSGELTGIDAHYSRVIHIATNVDEDPVWGNSRVDGVYDDATGYRNLRWAQYKLWWRMGTGFAHMTFPNASEEQIRTWIRDGYFNDIFTNSYFISGKGQENIEFKGVQGSFVNPTPFNETSLENFSIATGIPKNLLIGAQAGTLSGSDTNLRAYDKLISGDQEQFEPTVRELIDILMDFGQIEFDRKTKQYGVEWSPTFAPDERTQTQIELNREMIKEKKLNYMTVNEVRDLDKLEPVDSGNVIPGLVFKLLGGQPGQPGQQGPLNPNMLLSPQEKEQRDQQMEAPNQEIVFLEDELTNLLTRIKYDQTTREQAMEEAKVIILKHVDQTREMSLNRLRELTGQPISQEAPEVEKFDKELTAHYLTYFEVLLNDILKKRG